MAVFPYVNQTVGAPLGPQADSLVGLEVMEVLPVVDQWGLCLSIDCRKTPA